MPLIETFFERKLTFCADVHSSTAPDRAGAVGMAWWAMPLVL